MRHTTRTAYTARNVAWHAALSIVAVVAVVQPYAGVSPVHADIDQVKRTVCRVETSHSFTLSEEN